MTRNLLKRKDKVGVKMNIFIEKMIVLKDAMKRIQVYKVYVKGLEGELKEMMKDPELVARLMDKDLIKVILKKSVKGA